VTTVVAGKNNKEQRQFVLIQKKLKGTENVFFSITTKKLSFKLYKNKGVKTTPPKGNKVIKR